ncbi:unnamed protein product [Angiostrongylus costaricensis]|uniref:Cell wall protein DAN4-like n=1 Tax=Angiostrongylus costaricensis TaxID=334426 RepID=A0A0R3PRH6_ANGCS|nr:unnamed protein product [Angiostrongylus costaricensis]
MTHVLCDQYIIDKKKALESPHRPLSQFEETTLTSQLIIPRDYDGVATEINEETIFNVTEGDVTEHVETTGSRDSIYNSTSVATDSIKPSGRTETITSTADPQTFTHALIMSSSTPQLKTASTTTSMETLGNPQLTRNSGHFANVQKENYAQTFPTETSIEITSTSTVSAPPTNLVTIYVSTQESQFVPEKTPSVDSLGNFSHILAVSTNRPLPKVLVNTEKLPRNENFGISTPSSPYEDVVWSPLLQSQENRSYKPLKMIVKSMKQRAVNRKLRNFSHSNKTGAATARLSVIQNKRQRKSRVRMRMQGTKRPQANRMRNQHRKVGEKTRTERKSGSYQKRSSFQRQIGRLM